MNAGAGIFYDGTTAARHEVTIELLDKALRIVAADGKTLAEWTYDELEAVSSPNDVLRIGRADSPVLARLEVRDPKLMAEIDQRCGGIDRTGKTERRARWRVVAWTLGTTVSLLLVAFYGIPEIATRLTPLVPISLEHRLGQAVEAQMRSMLDTGGRGGKPFECGKAQAERLGRTALDRLIARLESAAHLSLPLQVAVVRRSEANAIALPGGHIYVFEGLIAKAENPDELAGVIAHEIGHVAHRDGTRSVLQAAGLSFLFGMVLGDFFGGGAVIIAARTLLQNAYTRDVETTADIYGADLVTKAGGDGRALGAMLQRIEGGIEPGVTILSDHPLTPDRIAVINEVAGPSKGQAPMLDAADWAALKRICAAG